MTIIASETKNIATEDVLLPPSDFTANACDYGDNDPGERLI